MPFSFAVAPMMDCTDRHYRYFLRLIAPKVRLYTEMITTQALLHGDVKHLLQFNKKEKYVALQLGGCEKKALLHCAKLGEHEGYDEININMGCPSPRVKAGGFGAALMLEPEKMAEMIAYIIPQLGIPLTIKCRIGVDHQDSYEYLYNFIQSLASAGCKTFIIHARKAWLTGLSPKENRAIPPLNYDYVWRIKQDFPLLTIILNGGLTSVSQIEAHQSQLDGVMLGRAAYYNPYLIAEIHRAYFPNDVLLTRSQVIEAYLPYISAQLKNKVKLTSITRHLFGLFYGQAGANYWRRYLSTHAHVTGASVSVLIDALKGMPHD